LLPMAGVQLTPMPLYMIEQPRAQQSRFQEGQFSLSDGKGYRMMTEQFEEASSHEKTPTPVIQKDFMSDREAPSTGMKPLWPL
jgi:hypothetical protein